MAVDVQAVLKADGIVNANGTTAFLTLNVGYPADNVDDLTPTKDELYDFTHAPPVGFGLYYEDNVKKFLGEHQRWHHKRGQRG